ncbi:hypothetical protein V6N12_070689 [Hibiscus sabdariffa]|uniref:Uncharacterized protein n=1 Tax=Hibiscus sabdariffa TaxID=183260 RepID=A0ABR2FHK0_9ROSI
MLAVVKALERFQDSIDDKGGLRNASVCSSHPNSCYAYKKNPNELCSSSNPQPPASPLSTPTGTIKLEMHDAYFSVAILIQYLYRSYVPGRKCTALLPTMDISLQVIEMQCFDITKNPENGRESSGGID